MLGPGACVPRLSITSDVLLTGDHHSNVSVSGQVVLGEISATGSPPGTGRLRGFLEIWRVTKIRRPCEFRGNIDRHEIWHARGPSQNAGRDVLRGVIRDEVIVGSVNPNRNCLLTISF